MGAPRRLWTRLLVGAGLGIASGLVGFWLVFTIQWLRLYLPHGGSW